MNETTDNQPVLSNRQITVSPLQHFEFDVLSSVNQLREKAFAAEIARRLGVQLGRHVSIAQVFVALERLEDKGYLKSHEIKPEPTRGGRRRRVFILEAHGEQALDVTTVANQSASTGYRHEPKSKYGPLPA